jgi:DNA-directed RNA polymerase specialized sigma24 family protein
MGRLTAEQRALVFRLRAKGLPLREIGRQVGCHQTAVGMMLRKPRQRRVRSFAREPGPGRAALIDRIEVG